MMKNKILLIFFILFTIYILTNSNEAFRTYDFYWFI